MKFVQVVVLYGDAVNPYFTGTDIIQAGDQLYERTFSRSGSACHSHRLARTDVETYVPQHIRLASAITEADLLKANLSLFDLPGAPHSFGRIGQ